MSLQEFILAILVLVIIVSPEKLIPHLRPSVLVDRDVNRAKEMVHFIFTQQTVVSGEQVGCNDTSRVMLVAFVVSIRAKIFVE